MRPDFDEDKDIKIMGQYNNNDKEDTVQAEHEYHLQHGNIEKARQFGAIMADEVMAWEGDQDNTDLLLNEQFLYVFAATVAFDCFTPSRITAVTALSAFYDRIKQSSPEFYLLCYADAVKIKILLNVAKDFILIFLYQHKENHLS